MEIKIKSKKDDVVRLSEKLISLSEIIRKNNLLPKDIVIGADDQKYSVSVEVDRISFANMFSLQDHELIESSDTLIVSHIYEEIKFYCKQSKKPRHVRFSAQELTNELWSIK